MKLKSPNEFKNLNEAEIQELSIENTPETTSSESAENPIQAISQILFETEIQTHITHLQAKDKSFEIHNALGDFYKLLGDLNDNLVEKSFNEYGLMMNYSSITVVNDLDPILYLKDKIVSISVNRELVKEGFIQQMIDNILETYSHVVYKLENLK